MPHSHRSLRVASTLAAAAALLASACTGERVPSSLASRVTSRFQLIGGPRALGDVGDYVMENDQVRVVIQAPGFSRGFGVYGGSLIDAELRHPDEVGSSGVPVGNDQFGELFPAFFVQAAEVDEVKVIADGSDGGPSIVEASGEAGDFLELAAILNRAVTGSNDSYVDVSSGGRLRYSTRYELHPGARHVVVRFRVQNASDERMTFPSPDALFLLGQLGLTAKGFTIPVGDVALFGATSKVFMPGLGFDLRFGLERAYQRQVDWPAFPGFATEFVASRGQGASYGLLAAESDDNYAFNKLASYDDGRTPVTRSSVLVPFVASSFVGVFYADAQPALDPGASMEVVKYFVVGDGDVGSVLDEMLAIQGREVGSFGGQVFDSASGQPLGRDDAMVVVYHDVGADEPDYRPYAQYDLRAGGWFRGDLPVRRDPLPAEVEAGIQLAPTRYRAAVVGAARPIVWSEPFTVSATGQTAIRVDSPPPGRLVARVVDEQGFPLPAKVTVVGTYPAEYADVLAPDFLYDLVAGQSFLNTDMVTDQGERRDPEGKTRRYIEASAFTDQGRVSIPVCASSACLRGTADDGAPRRFTVVASRGPEYGVASATVDLRPNQVATVELQLSREVDTTGWMSADTHIHSINSIDSGMELDERVLQLAAEGVEIAVATDHNYVTDYWPFVASKQLADWVHPVIGLELTTLESGHFNGYPLADDLSAVPHYRFGWADRPPDELFASLRASGRPGLDPIVQVNHPRDDLLGYFTQYARSTLTAAPRAQGFSDALISPQGPAFVDADGKTTFSTDYDAVEVLNGKLFWEIRHYRVPDAALIDGELPEDAPEPGHLLLADDGEVAWPGVVDDWFNLLNLGQRPIGVGSGDSHSADDEAGHCRTMVYVGHDDVGLVTDEEFVTALRSRRVVATNGPLVDFWINDPDAGAMGRTLSDADGTVELTVRLTAARWMSLSRVNVWRNGQLARSITVDPDRDLVADPLEETFELRLERRGGELRDSWFVIEAFGDRSLFPELRPAEVPPVLLTDAVASLAGPLGLSSGSSGALRPPEVFAPVPYAITNPIWVTYGEHDFEPPGLVPFEELDDPSNASGFGYGVVAESKIERKSFTVKRSSSLYERVDRVRRVPLLHPRFDNPFDVRKVMQRLGAVGGRHGHAGH